MTHEPDDAIAKLEASMSNHMQAGDLAAAIECGTKVSRLREQHSGKDSLEYARSANNLGYLLYMTGDYGPAETLLQQAVDIRRELLGADDLQYAKSLDNLAAVYGNTGGPDKAEPLLLEANDVLRRAVGEQNVDYAISLDNLASHYARLGDDGKAEPLCRKAGQILLEALGDDHPDYLTSMCKLAAIYIRTGRATEGESIYLEALEAASRGPNEQSSLVDSITQKLAMLYLSQANYRKAVPMLRAIAMSAELRLGAFDLDSVEDIDDLPGFRETAMEGVVAYLSLAHIYMHMGDDAEVDHWTKEALSLATISPGVAHPVFADILTSRVWLCRRARDYEGAIVLCQQALGIYERAVDKDDPRRSEALAELGFLYAAAGDYASAEPRFRQALDLGRRRQAAVGGSLAHELSNLGWVLHGLGRFGEAELVLREARAIMAQADKQRSPEYADLTLNLGVIYAALGRKEEAIDHIVEAIAVDDALAPHLLFATSDAARFAILEGMQSRAAALVTLVLQEFVNDQKLARLSENRTGKADDETTSRGGWTAVSACRTAMRVVVQRKAFLMEALVAQRRAATIHADPIVARLLQELNALRTEIADVTLAGPGAGGMGQHLERLHAAVLERQEVERRLAEKIPDEQLLQSLVLPGLREVAQALPQESVLVEYFQLRPFNFKAVPNRDELLQEAPRYVAFLMRANAPQEVRIVDLGYAEDIDDELRAFRTSVGKKGQGIAPKEQQPVMRGSEETGPTGAALRTLVFDSLWDERLPEHARLVIAPDGILSMLPFETLPTSDGGRLIDTHHISYLATARDAVGLQQTTQTGGEPAVFAAPDYDLASNTLGAIEKSPKDPDLDSWYFPPLSGASEEGADVGNLLGVEPLMGAKAVKARLKSLVSPSVLHLATHGFFVGQQGRAADRPVHTSRPVLIDYGGAFELRLPTQQALYGNEVWEESRLFGGAHHKGQMLGPNLANPQLRSGLALAGANTFLRGGATPMEAENGLLTAEDVCGLDLLNTDLVVLSACDTGLGDVHVGEGVFGLRRAFTLAGARTLVMSLWKVPDQQTRELMGHFYQALRQGADRSEALRDAQLAVKENHSDPLYWGAFICQGDPRPLTLWMANY